MCVFEIPDTTVYDPTSPVCAGTVEGVDAVHAGNKAARVFHGDISLGRFHNAHLTSATRGGTGKDKSRRIWALCCWGRLLSRTVIYRFRHAFGPDG